MLLAKNENDLAINLTGFRQLSRTPVGYAANQARLDLATRQRRAAQAAAARSSRGGFTRRFVYCRLGSEIGSDRDEQIVAAVADVLEEMVVQGLHLAQQGPFTLPLPPGPKPGGQ